MKYAKKEAKEWARQTMIGVCGSILPTFTSDLLSLNEKAIRHDVRRTIELGFWGAVLISECGTTLDEYVRFMEIAHDEAGGRLGLVAQNPPGGATEFLKVAQAAESIGLDAFLLGYPANFRPRSEREIIDWSAAIFTKTNLAGILYSSSSWDFGRIHPAALSLNAVRELTALPNVVAIKCEGGAPGTGAVTELAHHLSDRLLISDAQEFTSPSGIKLFNMQWLGTGNYDYYGNTVVQYFNALRAGDWDKGMALFWKMHPARAARFEFARATGAGHLVHRMGWKYQAWINGFNGGPLRGPLMRIDQRTADGLRGALVQCGIIPAETPGDLASFYEGRNPA